MISEVLPLPLPGNGRPLKGVLTASVLLAVLGCGRQPPTAEVTGKVTYKGEPIPVGMITFLADDNSGRADSSSILDGKYTLPKAPIGKVKIQVTGSSEPDPDARPTAVRRKLPPGMIAVAKSMGAEAGPPLEASGRSKTKAFQLPAKYGQAAYSGLTYEVQPGKQTHDIDLLP